MGVSEVLVGALSLNASALTQLLFFFLEEFL